MSRDELSDMEQLDGLTVELAEAGRIARVATAHREQPDPAFAGRLRAELLLALPTVETAAVDAPLVPGLPASVPMPPVRPLEMPGRFTERRSGGRPFVAAEFQPRTDELRNKRLDGAPVVAPTRADLTRAGRRWEALDGAAATRVSSDAATSTTSDAVGTDGLVVALKPSMRWHIPTSVLPSRWIGVGLAASIAVASMIYGSGVFVTPKTVATASDSVAAFLIRGGNTVALTDGTQLRENDEIKVAAAGRATLQLGDSYVRMAGGSDVQLKSLDTNHIVVSQVAGRVYHRVVVAAGGDYQVATATVTWKAVGTAFDVDRETTSGGGEQVRGLALYDGLDVTGPGLNDNISEGSSAMIVLRPDGAPDGSAGISPITSQTLADAWLVGNAGLDARLGLPLGQMAALVSPSSTATPTTSPTPQPTVKPVVATATPKPTAKPTPKPTPKPVPAGPPDLGTIKVVRNADSSYTISWPKYTGSGFLYYKLMAGDYPSSPSYGKSGDYWACNDTVTDTSWKGFIAPGNYSVRLQVIDEPDSKVVIRAETKIYHLVVSTPGMGSVSAHDNGNGTFTFSWASYGGSGSYGFYKLAYETTDSGSTPSYPDGSPIWAAVSAGTTSVTLTVGDGGFVPGDYKMRVQAIGWPDGFSCGYAYAQTGVLHLIVP